MLTQQQQKHIQGNISSKDENLKYFIFIFFQNKTRKQKVIFDKNFNKISILSLTTTKDLFLFRK